MTELEFIFAMGAIVVIAAILMATLTWLVAPRKRTFRPNRNLPRVLPNESTEQFLRRILEESDV